MLCNYEIATLKEELDRSTATFQMILEMELSQNDIDRYIDLLKLD